MIQKKFQDEPDAVPSAAATLSAAAARSLLLGLSIRGYLSGSECEWLASLAPDRWQVFLLDGQETVFPLDGCPFPHELLSSGGHEFGDAVFSQRHRASATGLSEVIRIHTAIINPGEPTPLTMGFYGPDTVRRDQTVDDRFFEVVGHLRLAYRGLDQIARRVHETLADSAPAIAVNRSSGRVLAVNRAVLDRLECDDSALIDYEYSQLADAVGSRFSDHAVTMHNVSDACLSLCLLSWEETVAPHSQTSETGRDLLPDSAPRPLTLITKAARLLTEMDDPELDPRHRALVEDILTNALRLERDFDRTQGQEDSTPQTEPSMDLVRL